MSFLSAEAVRTTILIIAGGLPAAGYAIEMILFSRLSLNAFERAKILVQLREFRGGLG